LRTGRRTLENKENPVAEKAALLPIFALVSADQTRRPAPGDAESVDEARAIRPAP